MKQKPPAAGRGRPKGSKNKTTRVIKEAVIEAASQSHPDGMVGYLLVQARENPVAFMGLIGRIIPLQHEGTDGPPIRQSMTIISGVPRADD